MGLTMAKDDKKKRWGLYFIAALLFLVPLGILASASCMTDDYEMPSNGNTTTTTAATTTNITTTVTTTIVPESELCPMDVDMLDCVCMTDAEADVYYFQSEVYHFPSYVGYMECLDLDYEPITECDDGADCWLAVVSCEDQGLSQDCDNCITWEEAQAWWPDEYWMHKCSHTICEVDIDGIWHFCFSDTIVNPDAEPPEAVLSAPLGNWQVWLRSSR